MNTEKKSTEDTKEINGAEEQNSEEIEELSREIEETEVQIENELQDLNQQYLRLAADFENYKRRVNKEREDSIAYGNEELIKEMLNILDNLQRALDHTEEKEDAKSLIDGVKLVQKQFLSTLEKFGVKPISASKGSEFDPMLHQAIEHAESNEIESGLVLSEMLPGYTLKERLLRPALVVVAKNKE